MTKQDCIIIFMPSCFKGNQNVFLYFISILINTLRLRQNGQHFADVFKGITLNENMWISFNVSLNFVPKGQIKNIPALVQIMAWCLVGTKPSSEPMMVSLLTHKCLTQPQWVKCWFNICQEEKKILLIQQCYGYWWPGTLFRWAKPALSLVH